MNPFPFIIINQSVATQPTHPSTRINHPRNRKICRAVRRNVLKNCQTAADPASPSVVLEIFGGAPALFKHRTGYRWSPVRTLPVAPLWCDLRRRPTGKQSCGEPPPSNQSCLWERHPRPQHCVVALQAVWLELSSCRVTSRHPF